jgi:type I restriction enzyme S subunit
LEVFQSPFVVLAINSSRFRSLVESKATGTTRSRIARGTLAQLPIPVPPLGEQRRIVAKVEELLGLCDELEARQTAARELGSKLLDSLIHHTLNP